MDTRRGKEVEKERAAMGGTGVRYVPGGMAERARTWADGHERNRCGHKRDWAEEEEEEVDDMGVEIITERVWDRR